MRVKKVLLTSVAAFAAFLALAAGALYIAYHTDLYVAESGPPPELFIRGGTVFDAKSTEPAPNAGILVRDGVIACMGAACETSDSAIEIDATELAILPGLIELHGHMFAPDPGMSLPALVWNLARYRPDVRRQLLEAGVTSFRDVGSPRDAVLDFKRVLNERELAGPRMFVAGPIFTAPGGHPAYGGQDPNRAGFGGDMAFQSDGPHAVREEVALLAEQGADGIKAVFHGAEGTEGRPSLPTLSARTLRALVEAAQAHDLWVAVHVGPLDETRQAAGAGVTSIEHGVRHGNAIDEETLRVLVESGTVYVPTLGAEPRGYLNIPALVEAGVALGVGTDSARFGESYHDELARLVDAGVAPAQALLAATRNGAKALRRSDMLGTIEEGKLADIIVVDGRPWEDVADLRRIVTVVQGGYIVATQAGTRQRD